MKYLSLFAIVFLLWTNLAAANSDRGNSSSHQNRQGSSIHERNKNLEFYFNSSGEVYFFNIIGQKDKHSGKDDDGNIVSYDYTGRKYKMEYEFQPVYLVSLESYVKWNFLLCNGLYKTNRFQGGGSIEHDTEIASKLTKNKVVSEILQLGIEVYNFRTSYRSVQFDFGTANVIDVETNQVVDKGNLKVNIQETDLQYDLCTLFNRDNYTFYIAYKYMQYSLPRIVYKLRETNPDGGDDEWEYVSESQPQNIELNTHMAGIGVSFGEKKSLDSFFSSEIYLGAGESELDFSSADSESVTDTDKKMFYSSRIAASTGLSLRPPTGSLQTSIRLSYEINLISYTTYDAFINNTSEEDDGNKKTYSFNSFDIYQGLNFSVNMLF